MAKATEASTVVKLSSKGQVVIPKAYRESLHAKEGDELLLIRTGEGLLIQRPRQRLRLRGLLKGLSVDAKECEAILGEAKRSLAKVVMVPRS